LIEKLLKHERNGWLITEQYATQVTFDLNKINFLLDEIY